MFSIHSQPPDTPFCRNSPAAAGILQHTSGAVVTITTPAIERPGPGVLGITGARGRSTTSTSRSPIQPDRGKTADDPIQHRPGQDQPRCFSLESTGPSDTIGHPPQTSIAGSETAGRAARAPQGAIGHPEHGRKRWPVRYSIQKSHPQPLPGQGHSQVHGHGASCPPRPCRSPRRIPKPTPGIPLRSGQLADRRPSVAVARHSACSGCAAPTCTSDDTIDGQQACGHSAAISPRLGHSPVRRGGTRARSPCTRTWADPGQLQQGAATAGIQHRDFQGIEGPISVAIPEHP